MMKDLNIYNEIVEVLFQMGWCTALSAMEAAFAVGSFAGFCTIM